MNVLVTGGTGFIGSHVVGAYADEGHRVVALDVVTEGREENLDARARTVKMDIREKGVADLLAEEKVEVVNHHAAQKSVSHSVEDPEDDARINILGLLNLLQACRKAGVKKVIFASSGGTVYGPAEQVPTPETHPFGAASPYGVAKVASELYLQFYAREHGLRCTALRYANVYGPRQDPQGEAGVVAIFAQRMLGGGKPVINGDGEYYRDYVYAEDVAKANVLALGKGDNEAVNIGTGRLVSTNDLFRRIAGLTGYRGREEHGPARAGDLRRNGLTKDRAKVVLGWEPATALEDGLRLTVDWFRSAGAR